MSKAYDVITIGSALRDMLFYTAEGEIVRNPKPDPTKVYLLGFELGAKLKSERVYQGWGGGAANTAVNFSGLGLTTGIITRIGTDQDGDNLKQYLRRKKVETKFIYCDRKERTGLSFIVIDQKRNEHVAFVYYGANSGIRVQGSGYKAESKWYYIGALNTPGWPAVLNAVIKTKRKIAWNPGGVQLAGGYREINKYLKYVEVLIVNRDEATELCLSAKARDLSVKAMLKLIRAWGAKLAVITEGQSGVQVYDGRNYYQGIPNHQKPVDTTGAGDCFGSTFVAGLIKGFDIELAIKLGLANTAALVMQPGSQHGLLTWREIKKGLCK